MRGMMLELWVPWYRDRKVELSLSVSMVGANIEGVVEGTKIVCWFSDLQLKPQRCCQQRN
jgi:hypothetical protein